ncbi:MAG: GYDIA family GHMP kinase [Bacteroidota bacterium]|nr:GYDIA family GHMP kinase [Bacteroidota bacterium]
MKENFFYSNGKLLLTGEYTILDGAKALALPTSYGQDLHIENTNTETISWKSYDVDKSTWIDTTIDFEQIRTNTQDSPTPIINRLIEILHEAYKLNPDFLNNGGYQIRTHLTFPKDWGLGTSSTLINNLSKWLQINPYQLLRNTFSGSGYDIACADTNRPIVFELHDKQPQITPINFNPSFAHHLYFVHLNKKQNSKSAIASYYKKQPKITHIIPQINNITESVIKTDSFAEFSYLLEKHEVIMSNVLEMQTAKEALFKDYKGVIKSLGAWGGDFILALSEQDPTSYFVDKGYCTIVPYSKMIL